MVQIAKLLPEYDCYFSQFYSDSKFVNWIVRRGWMDTTILAGKFRADSERILKENNMKLDYRGLKFDDEYDLSILCTDLIVPKKARKSGKVIWIQEGMVDRVTLGSRLVKLLGLPRYLAMGTSLNGSSDICDVYCCASEGYKDFFTKMGTSRDKLIVTGIPNYDDLIKYKNNNFEHKGYVMVATSDIRETFKKEDRIAFIKKCVDIANGRQLLFKFHPNEDFERGTAEIRSVAPEDTLIYTSGSTNEMIANAVELITQWSTVVYVGMAFDIPVHSYFNVGELRQLMPQQNGGSSAEKIAHIARAFMKYEGDKSQFVDHYQALCGQENVALQKGKNTILECPEF
ncbi:MAG: hypothetical protein AAF598_11245 [Bacteroidota bacterium]